MFPHTQRSSTKFLKVFCRYLRPDDRVSNRMNGIVRLEGDVERTLNWLVAMISPPLPKFYAKRMRTITAPN